MESTNKGTNKAVYTIVEKPGNKSVWVRIGWVSGTNRDGSYNIHLDALPVNGKLQVRNWEPREEFASRPRREEASSAQPV